MFCIINCQNVVIKYNTRVWREYFQQKYQNINRIINNINFFCVCVCIYKMVNITKETYENNEIEVISDEFGKLWLNERHVQEQLGLKNLPAITNKYDKKYKKCRYELNQSTKQSHRRFIRNDLTLKVIIDCRTDESCNLKRNLGFTLHDVMNTKEQTVINLIKDAFERENMQTQCTVLSYRIDFYFHKYKLVIEIDELRHSGRNINY